MDTEIALTPSDEQKRNTGIRYDKQGPNFGVLDKDIYTTQGLADILGVHTTTVLEQIKTGRLRALYLGGPAGYRIHRDDIIAWVRGIRGSDPSNEGQ